MSEPDRNYHLYKKSNHVLNFSLFGSILNSLALKKHLHLKYLFLPPLGICRPGLPQYSPSDAPNSKGLLYTRNIKTVEHQEYWLLLQWVGKFLLRNFVGDHWLTG
jgi:hypothetical protein